MGSVLPEDTAMMFPKPMRLEPWVAFDGAVAVDVVDALTGQTDAADADAENGSSSESAAAAAASAFAAPMAAGAPAEAEPESGLNEIDGNFLNDGDDANNGYKYELDLPYGVAIPADGKPFLPFYDEAELELEDGLEDDAQSLYFEVRPDAVNGNGTFDFYGYKEVEGQSLPGFKTGDHLFVKGNTDYLYLYRCADDNRFYMVGDGFQSAISRITAGGGINFTLFNSENIHSHSDIVDASEQASLLFRSLVFTPNTDAGGSVGSFSVGVYYQKTEPGNAINNAYADSPEWYKVTDDDNEVVKVVDGSVRSNPDGSVHVPESETGDGGGDDGGDETGDGPDDSDNEQGSDTQEPPEGGTTEPELPPATDPTPDPDPVVAPEPTPDPTPTPEPQPEPTPEPDPAPVDVVPEVAPPVTPPPSSADSGGSAGDAPSAEAPAAEAGAEAGAESGAESAESGDAGDAMGADDLVYIQQREADSDDAAAAAAASQRPARADAAADAVPVTVEALPVEAAAMFELARDLENLLGTVRSDRAGLEEILVRLRDEYLARPGDDWGEARSVLRRLFDSGNAEMQAINRVIAELTRQMDDFDSLSAARRDGMVMESLRELAISVERRGGETGAITQALTAVVEALSAARLDGREVDPAAVAALYERVYGREIAAWSVRAQRQDPMGRDLAAARAL